MKLPTTDLLNKQEEYLDDSEQKETVKALEKFFEEHDKKVKITGFEKGPTISKYHIIPHGGTTYNEIKELNYDIAMAVKSKAGMVYISPPIVDYFNIEIPNKKREIVSLRTLLESEEYKKEGSSTAVPIGLSVYGRDYIGSPEIIDLKRVAHMLIAGSTGSGKSVFLHTIINSLMFRNTPQELKFILVDPKRVEFYAYGDMPHLVSPIITHHLDYVKVFEWLVDQMKWRFSLLEQSKTRDIDHYNEANPDDPLDRIVLIVDEFSDCIISSPDSIEKNIVRLAQLSRAVGIHMILCTSRPSHDVFTGLIKANIPSVIAFNTVNSIDSNFIIYQSGAERLLGMGDMLFVPPDSASPKRIQAPFISEKEINDIVQFLKDQKSPDYDFDLLELPSTGIEEFDFGEYESPIKHIMTNYVTQKKKVNATELMEKFEIKYPEVEDFLKYLDDNGYIERIDEEFYYHINPQLQGTVLVNPNDIKVEFGGPDHPEKDEKLIELLGKAHKDKIPVYSAIIKISAIKPFCMYEPSADTMYRFRSTLIERINKGVPPKLHVYPEGDLFVMSDDYVAYHLYLDLRFDSVPCVLFGDSNSRNVIDKELIKYRL